MFSKNCLALVGAVAAVHGVAAQQSNAGPLDIDSARAQNLFPKTFAERLLMCDTGKIDFNSDRPCDLEKAEDARLLQEAGLDPANEKDRNDAKKVSNYRKGVQASVFRNNARNCCLDCKRIHEIHNAEQDNYWKAFYSDDKMNKWYSAVDEWAAGKTNKPVPLLWNYLQSLGGNGAPSSDLTVQALKVTEKKLDSYCPALTGHKDKVPALSANATASVTFNGRCMNFYVEAEAKSTVSTPLRSAKFPSNVTVSAKAEVFADLFVTCPVFHVEGTQGNTAYSNPLQVQGSSVKVDAKAEANIIRHDECSACQRNTGLSHAVAFSEDFDKKFTKGAPAEFVKQVMEPKAGPIHVVNEVNVIVSSDVSVRISGDGAPARTSAGNDAPPKGQGAVAAPANAAVQNTVEDNFC